MPHHSQFDSRTEPAQESYTIREIKEMRRKLYQVSRAATCHCWPTADLSVKRTRQTLARLGFDARESVNGLADRENFEVIIF